MQIIFNKISTNDLDIKVVKKPFIPPPKKGVESIGIEGKDGNYYIDKETYEDISINVDFNFFSANNDDLELKSAKIQNWLNDIEDNKLIIDNSMFYFKVKNIEVSNIEYDGVYEISKFTVNFICEAYKYLRNDYKQNVDSSHSIFNNMYALTKPVYYITGNGTLNVNGNVVTITNNTDGIIIDTTIGKVLNNSNTVVTGKTNINAMSDLYLKKGMNNITYSGIQLQIKTNYRTL